MVPESQEIQFKRKEIVRIFVMLVGVSLIVFSLGIFIGRESPKMVLEPSVIPSVSEESLPTVVDQKPSPLPLNGFTIQVALFETPEEAQKEKERLQSLGFPSISLREATVENRLWHFVDLGFFKNKEKARTYATLLQKKKVISSYFIRGAHLDESTKN
ncbi:MAG: SPOR domain-containing protein [Deltaproteobacteria bacterium]|nr:SPOR domain-containing protein [Deltaproteobacteria bacterium]